MRDIIMLCRDIDVGCYDVGHEMGILPALQWVLRGRHLLARILHEAAQAR